MSKRSPLHRRDILERIRRRGAEPGPLIDGLRESDGIVVASFYSPYVCRRFRRALSGSGISSEVTKDGSQWSVAVKLADREVAGQLVAQQRLEYPDHRPRGTRGAHDFTILGMVAGTTAGVISLAWPPTLFVQVAVWAGFIGTGTVVGYMADRFQRSYRYLGRLQFDMTDYILLVTAAAVVLSFWTFVVRLI